MENKTQKKETPKQLSNKKKEFKLTLDKLKDNKTYNAEGSKQNKLHHPSCYSGVTIGAGYDLKYRTEKEVEKDLKEVGMSQNDINILKKGVKLTNEEADNFVKQNPNFRIDEKVKKQLFCNEYNKKSKIIQRIIEKTKEIKWDDIPNDVKEYLVDLTYRGDLIPKIQPKIREAVKDIIENKNTKKFEELNLSLHGKKIPNREKRRDDLTKKIAQNVKNNKKEKEDNYIGIHNNNNDGGNNNNNNVGNNNNNNNNNYNLKYKKNISKQSSLKSNSTNDSLNEIKVKLPNNIKGGIDMEYNYDLLIKNCKNIKFQGIFNKSDLMLFRQKNQFKSYKRNVFINLEDVAVILKILYDETITHKNISFSLDPFEPKNPTGAFMRKVFYPDVYEGKKILEGTQIGEDMFIADFLLKQLSLGYKPDNSKFEIPYQLSSHGLKSFNYSNNNINTINRRFSRVSVIIKKMENIIKNNNLFCIDNIQLGVDARQMEISEDGTLKDKKIQDINDQCYIFASKFSELYDIASNIYKCFYRLKEIAGAIAFAKWIYQNKFPLNLNLINKIYESTLIPNYNIKVPSIQHFETHTFTNNIPVNIDDCVIQYLKDKGIEINYINIENYKNIIRQNNINCSIKRTTSLKKYINGGVDLWNSLLINGAEKNILNNSFSSFSTIDDESNLNLIHFDNLNNIQIDLSDCDVQVFPFIKKCFCQICS